MFMETTFDKVSLVSENETCSIKVAIGQSLLYLTWKKHAEGEDLYTQLLHMLAVVNKYRLKHLICDSRAQLYIKLEDMNWLMNTFLPQFRRSSIVRFARIETACSLVSLNSMQLHKKFSCPASNHIAFESFYDEESAVSWLLQS